MKKEEKKKKFEQDILLFLEKNKYGIETKYEVMGYHYYFNTKLTEKNIPDKYRVENFLKDIFKNMEFVKIYIKDKLKDQNNRQYLKDFMHLYLTDVIKKYDYEYKIVSEVIDIIKQYPSLKDFVEHKNIITYINPEKFKFVLKNIKSQDDKNDLLSLFMLKNKYMVNPDNYLDTALDNQKKFWESLKEEQLFSNFIIKEIFQKFENNDFDDEKLLESLKKCKKIYHSTLMFHNLEDLFQQSSVKNQLTFREFLNQIMQIREFKTNDNFFSMDYTGGIKIKGLDIMIKSQNKQELSICEDLFFQHLKNVFLQKPMPFHDMYLAIKNQKDYELMIKDVNIVENKIKKPIKV